MANFMPSFATSLNQAGAQTLERVLVERELQRKMAEQQTAQQRQMFLDQFNVGMRLQDQQQQERDFTFRKEQTESKAKLDAEERDRKLRQERNEAGAREIFATGVQQGAPRQDLTRAALDGKVPVSLMPKEPVKEKSLEEKIRETEALSAARARGSQSVKPTKVAKDNPKAPSQFKQTIQNRVGSAGFKTASEAIRSIKKNWPRWRENYPGLEVNAVEAVIKNIYGQEPTARMTRIEEDTPPASKSGGLDLAAIKARTLARMNGVTPK